MTSQIYFVVGGLCGIFVSEIYSFLRRYYHRKKQEKIVKKLTAIAVNQYIQKKRAYDNAQKLLREVEGK